MSEPPGTASRLPAWLRDYLCGAFAGGANVLVGYPFDTVKVGGFFVGVSAPLIGGALECGVNYLTYTSALHALEARSFPHAPYANTERPELSSERSSQSLNDEPPLTHIAAAAAVAGVTLSFILSPVELVKCRLQVNAQHYRNPIHCLKLTVKEEGVRGLTRGLGATLAREVPGNALFFVVYEAVKWSLMHRSESATVAGEGSDAENSLSQALQRLAVTISAGGVAGCAMWGSVLPIDSAKTRIQAARPGDKFFAVGLIRALQLTWVEGGVRSWWAGLGPTILRAFPANAAQWLAWEGSLQLMS